jgi:hypothetical protein
MNIRQRISLVGGFLVIILNALFPPSLVQVQIVREFEPPATYYESVGPRFLLMLPRPEVTEKGPYWYEGEQLDTSEHNRKGEDGIYFLRPSSIDYR